MSQQNTLRAQASPDSMENKIVFTKPFLIFQKAKLVDSGDVYEEIAAFPRACNWALSFLCWSSDHKLQYIRMKQYVSQHLIQQSIYLSSGIRLGAS